MCRTHEQVAVLSPPPKVITSFIVRIVQDSPEGESSGSPPRWRGVVRHLQTGREQHFLDVSDAALFIAEFVPKVENSPPRPAEGAKPEPSAGP